MARRLSEIVNGHVEQMFAPHAQARARALLLEITASGSGNQGPDRCETAALKVSGGTISGLEDAVAMYHLDFRDLLVSAGFGSDTKAHETWNPYTE
ncbi:hypothetical protein [Sulfitobacter aestuariivivens]|uniref:Uncharacterized protein n=1 Tax=Sulfitobacter aestuariivivens TaxID=2766981 RepID=A0A927D2W5_9RHOB|nr:hypothetical protein [Sulfitobacter aestuariivivens]MBD3662909.1 hypothetical protein [Sulfitobacter aestuariivivens]